MFISLQCVLKDERSHLQSKACVFYLTITLVVIYGIRILHHKFLFKKTYNGVYI